MDCTWFGAWMSFTGVERTVLLVLVILLISYIVEEVAKLVRLWIEEGE